MIQKCLKISLLSLGFMGMSSWADTYLIDVRTPQEYQEKHAENAFNIPYDEINTRISELTADKNDTLYLYCRSGNRANIAADQLKSLGYQHVINLGTLEAAIQANISTTK